MYYFGNLKNTRRVEVFYSKKIPTLESHGNLYNLVYGGYKTKEESLLKADYQYIYNNIVFIDNRNKNKLNADRALSMILSSIPV